MLVYALHSERTGEAYVSGQYPQEISVQTGRGPHNNSDLHRQFLMTTFVENEKLPQALCYHLCEPSR